MQHGLSSRTHKIWTSPLALLTVVCLPLTALAADLDIIRQRERLATFQSLTEVVFIDKSTSGGCLYNNFDITVVDPEDTSAPRKIRVTEVRPGRQKTALPAVVVAPTIEGVTQLEWALVDELCHDQFVAYIADIHLSNYPEQMPAAGFEDLNSRLSVSTMRTIISWVQKQPSVLGDKLSFIGNSLGGITGSMLAAVEDRLKAVVISGAGGNLPYILAQSEVRQISNIRQKRMAYLKMTERDDYQRWLESTITFDPLLFARFAPRDRLLMMRITNDQHVPTEEQMKLWYALGGPRFEDFSLGHVGSIVALVYLYYDLMADFIRSKI